MSTPTWITPSGSLGVIPEGVFFQQSLVATVPPQPVPANCTATSITTNLITCDTTEDVIPGYVVIFTGTEFGGLAENTPYFVLAVPTATTFSITATAGSSTAVSLSTATGIMTAQVFAPVAYRLVAGTLPRGVQINSNGLVTGIPQAVASVQGVPTEVNQDVTSKFAIRATALQPDGTLSGIADRTFTLTVTGNDVPAFITPAGAFATNNTAAFAASISGSVMTVSDTTSGEITLGMSLRGPGVAVGTTVTAFINGSGGTGTYRVSIAQSITTTPIQGVVGIYYDGDQVILQIQYVDLDPGDTVTVRQIAGTLPPGLTLSSTGLLSGYIQPAPLEEQPPGYDLTPIATVPFDFLVSAISRNYQFTLEVTDGKASDIRTFSIFVYNKDDLSADDTFITGDDIFVTADQTTERAPFLLNQEPSDLGRVRGDNYFAYRFVGEDYDTELVEYSISVNQGLGLPPGLTLDPYSGWYYGFIPDQGATEVIYSFNIQVRARSLVITATTAGTNIITADGTNRPDLYVGAAVTFEGTGIGGIDPGTVYYVVAIPSDTTFQISTSIAGAPVVLTTATASSLLLCVPEDIAKSQLYPFTLTITGVVDSEVIWLTDSALGVIENGATSLLRVEAVNVGGRQLEYQLASGAFNELPQGLQLLPSGDIAGRVTFNTFSVDLGTTTFDASQSTVTGQELTTFDSTFVFTVNAYAPDTQQTLFKVSEVIVDSGGLGFSSAPALTFNTPIGASAVQAEATVTVAAGAITVVTVTESGDGYIGPAVYTLTGAGSGSESLRVVMQATGSRDAVSVFKQFRIRVLRRFNKPYQNLYVLAMPPQNDRALLRELLDDQEIFVPEYIFRPTDPNFGLSTQVRYQHAFGLDAKTFETYVESLYLNHYWKNLVLGQIRTAQARNAQDEVIYEVVYSQIIDNLLNTAGASVSKIVTLPYAITDPADGSTQINSVYPNSLINMRDQVIDVVGRQSQELPLWMTSKQADGRVLGFTPAWVICYANPGRAEQIAYYIRSYFGERLNLVDFKVDRYELDGELTRNWNAATQSFVPTPSLTTFDRINTTGFTDLGIVGAATDLAFADVNSRTIQYINALGGLDGPTWIAQAGQTPPVGTQVTIRDGTRMIFVKQENYVAPGSVYDPVDNAWSQYLQPFDMAGFNGADSVATPGSFDYAPLIPGGYTATCTATTAGTDQITSDSTVNMTAGTKVWFTGSVFGGIDATASQGQTQVYYVLAVANKTITGTITSLNWLTTASTADLTEGDQVWFPGTTIGGIQNITADAEPRVYYIVDVPTGTNFQISDTPGGAPITLPTAGGSMTMNLNRFTVTLSPTSTTPVSVSTDTGTMTANWGNQRMSIWEISITPGLTPNVDDFVTLTEITQTVTNDFVTVSQGQKNSPGTLLYRPGLPQQSLSRINWQPLITATTIISTETIFDQGSLQFVEPVDMYDPTDRYDKYLVFPKSNILV